MNDPLIRELEALRVGPDEVLIVRVCENCGDFAAELSAALENVGLAGRALVLHADDVSFAVVPRPDPEGDS